MSEYLPALNALLPEEGRESNNPHDAGRETYCGISRPKNPDWSGWPRIDAAKQAGLDLKSDQVFQSVQDDITQFYFQAFWAPSKAGWLESQPLANFYFGCCVNLGQGEAVKLLQRAILFASDKVDGAIGPQTLSVANADVDCLNAYCNEVGAFYDRLGIEHPEDEAFEKGWHNRIHDYQFA